VYICTHITTTKNTEMAHFKGRWRLKTDKDNKTWGRLQSAFWDKVKTNRARITGYLSENGYDTLMRIPNTDICDAIAFIEKLKN